MKLPDSFPNRQERQNASQYMKAEHKPKKSDIERTLRPYWEQIKTAYAEEPNLDDKRKMAMHIQYISPQEWQNMPDKEDLFSGLKPLIGRSVQSAQIEKRLGEVLFECDLLQLFPEHRQEIIEAVLPSSTWYTEVKQWMQTTLQAQVYHQDISYLMSTACTFFPELKRELQKDIIEYVERHADAIHFWDVFVFAQLVPKRMLQSKLDSQAATCEQFITQGIQAQQWLDALRYGRFLSIILAEQIEIDESGIHLDPPKGKHEATQPLPERSIL